MKIEIEQVKGVCGLGTGDKTCSYLACGAAWECLKGTEVESTILSRREAGTINAMGDNCSGPPDLIENALDGYDESPLSDRGRKQ